MDQMNDDENDNINNNNNNNNNNNIDNNNNNNEYNENNDNNQINNNDNNISIDDADDEKNSLGYILANINDEYYETASNQYYYDYSKDIKIINNNIKLLLDDSSSSSSTLLYDNSKILACIKAPGCEIDLKQIDKILKEFKNLKLLYGLLECYSDIDTLTSTRIQHFKIRNILEPKQFLKSTRSDTTISANDFNDIKPSKWENMMFSDKNFQIFPKSAVEQMKNDIKNNENGCVEKFDEIEIKKSTNFQDRYYKYSINNNNRKVKNKKKNKKSKHHDDSDDSDDSDISENDDDSDDDSDQDEMEIIDLDEPKETIKRRYCKSEIVLLFINRNDINQVVNFGYENQIERASKLLSLHLKNIKSKSTSTSTTTTTTDDTSKETSELIINYMKQLPLDYPKKEFELPLNIKKLVKEHAPTRLKIVENEFIKRYFENDPKRFIGILNKLVISNKINIQDKKCKLKIAQSLRLLLPSKKDPRYPFDKSNKDYYSLENRQSFAAQVIIDFKVYIRILCELIENYKELNSILKQIVYEFFKVLIEYRPFPKIDRNTKIDRRFFKKYSKYLDQDKLETLDISPPPPPKVDGPITSQLYADNDDNDCIEIFNSADEAIINNKKSKTTTTTTTTTTTQNKNKQPREGAVALASVLNHSHKVERLEKRLKRFKEKYPNTRKKLKFEKFPLIPESNQVNYKIFVNKLIKYYDVNKDNDREKK